MAVTNINQGFNYNMAAKTSCHRYGTKLRQCHSISGFLKMQTSTWTFEAGGKWERAEEGSEGKEGWSFLSVSVQ